MKEILQKIFAAFGSRLPSAVFKAFDTISQVFTFLNRKMDKKEENEALKRQKDIEKTVDKDSLYELLRKVSAVFALCLVLSGCLCEDPVQITTTNGWEGHYMSVKDFENGTSDMELRRGESVWVLSNETLKEILRNK